MAKEASEKKSRLEFTAKFVETVKATDTPLTYIRPLQIIFK
jgi:hypothetical protein